MAVPPEWRAGLLSPADQATWESYDRSFVALAGLEWRIQMRAMEAARQAVEPSRFLELKYEALCDRPMETFRQVLEYAELPASPAFERQVAATPLRNASQRWRDGLTPAQQRILDDLLRDDLLRYGYEPSPRGQEIAGVVAR